MDSPAKIVELQLWLLVNVHANALLDMRENGVKTRLCVLVVKTTLHV